MKPPLLLKGVPPLVRPDLPSGLRDFHSGARWSYLVKIYYGNEQIHYEASHHSKRRCFEIGLHFEADDLTNLRLLGAFGAKQRAIHRKIPEARIEAWDKGWARVWEEVTYEHLDEALQQRLAKRLALYIATLEPILRDELPADVEWSLAGSRR